MSVMLIYLCEPHPRCPCARPATTARQRHCTAGVSDIKGRWPAPLAARHGTRRTGRSQVPCQHSASSASSHVGQSGSPNQTSRSGSGSPATPTCARQSTHFASRAHSQPPADAAPPQRPAQPLSGPQPLSGAYPTQNPAHARTHPRRQPNPTQNRDNTPKSAVDGAALVPYC